MHDSYILKVGPTLLSGKLAENAETIKVSLYPEIKL